jgi:exodeoxyribonuclease V alpha subunit
MTVLLTLERLRELEVIAPIDEHFARSVARLAGGAPFEVLLGAAVASARAREGHVCAELARLAGAKVRTAEGKAALGLRFPKLEAWVTALEASPIVNVVTDVDAEDAHPARPLVFERGAARLYLCRYHLQERRLAELLRARAGAPPEPVDAQRLREGIARLFPLREEERRDLGLWAPRRAAALALLRRLSVIAGGPGTGKTSTVVKLLALLLEQAEASGAEAPRTVLVAPTGKAAARLSEAIRAAKATLPCSYAVKAAIPDDASTIHRRLRPMPGPPGFAARFEHDAENPLAADVVIVDEASMVDLALMMHLVDAVPPEARLILLGDRDQLASVDAGAVLGDLCDAGARVGPSRDLPARIAALTGEEAPAPRERARERPGIGDSIVHLTTSYRYREASGIGALARAIHQGDAASARAILTSGDHDDIALRPLHTAESAALRATIVGGFRPYLELVTPARRFEAFGRFRILCAHRRGPYGVALTNELVERVLAEAGLLRPMGLRYAGRPVLVTVNDYDARLFNGDVGMLIEDDASRGAIRAFFPSADGSMRRLSAARLPAHETAFAMTVHKSQGSEFDEVVVLLPEALSPILTRELLYTAVTRARQRVTIFGSAAIVAEAVARRVARASGLERALSL